MRRIVLAAALSLIAIGAPIGSAWRRPICASGWATTATCSIRRCRASTRRASCSPSICDKLFDIDEKGNIVPQLALGSETSADGKTVTMKLRPGVKFHDGEPFDAAAAKYSLDRHLTMKGSFRRSEISVVDSVDVVDPLTIKLNLKAPFSPLLAQLTDRAGMMMAPKATEAAGDKFALHPVCAGPYKFVERIAQDRIVVEKFADYWNKDQVFIDKITYRPIVDSTIRLANLKSGSLDLIERVLATDIKDVRSNPKLRLSKAVSLGWFGLLINMNNGPKSNNPLGKDPRVRQAFELAHRPRGDQPGRLQRRVRAGQPVGQPAEPVLSEGLPGPEARPRQGQGADAGSRRQDAGDDRLHGDQRARDAGASPRCVQAMVAEAGFDLKLRVTEAATAQKQAEDGEYQLYMNNWSGRIDPDGNTVLYQTCSGPMNMGKYCDKEVDALHEQARTANDLAARNAAYEKLAAKFLQNGWIVYLYHPQYLIASTDRVEGFKPMPDGLIRVVGVKLK